MIKPPAPIDLTQVEVPEFTADWSRYPHLALDDEIMREIFARDPVIVELYQRIEDIRDKARRYDGVVLDLEGELQDIQVQLDGLIAQVRTLDTQSRAVKGKIAQARHRKGVEACKVSEIIRRITTRRQHLCRKEINRKLAAIGREIKEDVGRRVMEMRYDGIAVPSGGGRVTVAELINPSNENGTHQTP